MMTTMTMKTVHANVTRHDKQRYRITQIEVGAVGIPNRVASATPPASLSAAAAAAATAPQCEACHFQSLY